MWLLCGESAVHYQRMPRHEGRLIAGQIQRGMSRFLRRSLPAHRDNSVDGFLEPAFARYHRCVEGCVDPSRTQAVDSNTAACVVECHLLREHDYATLGGTVGGNLLLRDQSCRRSCVDHRASSALEHGGDRVPGTQERTREINGDAAAPVLPLDVDDS